MGTGNVISTTTNASTGLCTTIYRGLDYVLHISGGTNQTIIRLIDKFSLFEINRYLIKFISNNSNNSKRGFLGQKYTILRHLGQF
jgi:hypothetical protein